ncbi:MAG TPA: hypothetical protein VFX02_09200 [Gammaproteobacteria bacterium]|nr:hypothetical protein [Gammaproteobacteria bacterium]
MAMETPSKSTQSQSYEKSAGNGGAQRATGGGSSSSASESFNIDPSSIERAKSSVHDAVDRIADSATQAAQKLGARADQMKEWQQTLIDNCSQYVREKPLQSLGIAVASGFVLSRILFR